MCILKMSLHHLLACTVPDVKSAEYNVFLMDYFIILSLCSRFSLITDFQQFDYDVVVVFLFLFICLRFSGFLDLEFVVFHSFWENLSYYLFFCLHLFLSLVGLNYMCVWTIWYYPTALACFYFCFGPPFLCLMFQCG